LRKIGGDISKLPALDARYHANCLKDYVKVKSNENESKDKGIHDRCFDQLVEYLDVKLLEGRAMNTLDLLNRYKNLLKMASYEHYDLYTAQKLRVKLLNRYGSKIKITEEVNHPNFIYSSEVRIGEMINIAQVYKQMIKDKELENDEPRKCEDNILERAAVILQRDFDDATSISIDPLVPEDIGDKRVEEIVPVKLKNFLNKLCNYSKNNASKKKILSIAQDIITVSSHGRKLMPKNVALGVSLKSSVRSKEFITYLNQLGHCISYDTVLRIETRWANSVLSESNDYSTIPSNIQHMIFTQAASDNGDYAQENKSQHVTNTVLYQYQTYYTGSFGTNITSREKSSSRRRSIRLPSIELDEVPTQGRPLLPRTYYKSEMADMLRNESPQEECINSLNSSWILLRFTGNKIFSLDVTQNVPAWTGFRKLLSV